MFYGRTILSLLAGLVILLGSLPVDGQPEQVARHEREHKNSDAGWTIISLKENGIALVRDNEKYRDGERLIEMVFIDTTLTETKSVEIDVQNRMILSGYEYSGNRYIDLLFREGETDQSNLLLVEYDINSGESVRYDIKNQFNFKLTHFTIVEKNAVLGGYVSREPAVVIYDKEARQLKVVPGFFTSDTELLDLRMNQNGTFNTLVISRSSVPEKMLLLRTFDKTGVQLLEDRIILDPGKTILSALTSSLIRDELLIAGTYGIGNSRLASGFFSVVADPFSEQPVFYHDFPKLGHFLDYVNPKRSEKIKTASQRNRLHGKDPDFKAYVSNVRLEEYTDGFFLLAEVYNSVTGSVSTMHPYHTYNGYYSPYGGFSPYSPYTSRYYNSPYNNTQPLTSSVKVIQSAVVAFGPDGKLEWDHSLRVDNEERNALEQASDFLCDRNSILIMNKMESELTFKERFKNDESRSDTVKIILKNPADAVRDESDDSGGVRHWYNDTFYTWGYHTVKDPTADERLRNVFYIVKIDAN